jgi:hypothetical protein
MLRVLAIVGVTELAMLVALTMVFYACSGCAAPGILGGPTAETTQKTCWDGTVCAQWQDCPNLAAPGRCEAPSGMPPQHWKSSPYVGDAGARD